MTVSSGGNENKLPIKNLELFNFDNENEFTFSLKREHLYPYDAEQNPEGLNLLDWFAGYSKEAKVSTAGIRGPQNIIYPQDTRFPINLVGIVLATLAKALVAREKYEGKDHAQYAKGVRRGDGGFQKGHQGLLFQARCGIHHRIHRYSH